MPHFAAYVEMADGSKKLLGGSTSFGTAVGYAEAALGMVNAFKVYVLTDGADEPTVKFVKFA